MHPTAEYLVTELQRVSDVNARRRMRSFISARRSTHLPCYTNCMATVPLPSRPGYCRPICVEQSAAVNTSIATIASFLRYARSFSVVAPSEWNRLPQHIRAKQSIDSFKVALKSYLLTTDRSELIFWRCDMSSPLALMRALVMTLVVLRRVRNCLSIIIIIVFPCALLYFSELWAYVL